MIAARNGAHFATRSRHRSIAALVDRLRSLRHEPAQWCPGAGVAISTGATRYGLASCPYCPKRVRTVPAPMARYRIIGAHTRGTPGQRWDVADAGPDAAEPVR
jgi:hypothetical protein